MLLAVDWPPGMLTTLSYLFPHTPKRKKREKGDREERGERKGEETEKSAAHEQELLICQPNVLPEGVQT